MQPKNNNNSNNNNNNKVERPGGNGKISNFNKLTFCSIFRNISGKESLENHPPPPKKKGVTNHCKLRNNYRPFSSLRSKRFRSIALSTGLKHFPLFERAKTVLRSPPKSEKCLEHAEKSTETLATHASPSAIRLLSARARPREPGPVNQCRVHHVTNKQNGGKEGSIVCSRVSLCSLCFCAPRSCIENLRSSRP